VQNWEKLSFERKGSSLQSDLVELKGGACLLHFTTGWLWKKKLKAKRL
jgi:hypothetical protein